MVHLPQAEEVVEHLGLDDLRGLGHADPLGQAGQLDRRRHRDEVAVALGKGLVERDQPVLGPVRGLGDLGGERVGQRLGRTDEDDAGVEFEQAPAIDVRREAAHESDVARPEQSLGRGSSWRGQEPHATYLAPVTSADWPSDRPGRRGPLVRCDAMWSGAVRVAQSASRSPGADRQVEAVLRRGERAGPAGVERAGRLEREVEVHDERAGRRIAAQVSALGGIDEVATGGVRLGAVGPVAERDEQAARVACHPEHRQRPFAGSGRGVVMRPTRLKARVSAPLFGSSSAKAPGAGGGAGSTTTSKRSAGSWSKWAARKVARASGGTGDCGMLAIEHLADRPPVGQRDGRVVGGHRPDLRVERRDASPPVGQPGTIGGRAVALRPGRVGHVSSRGASTGRRSRCRWR